MLNKVILIGRLTRDPELRFTPTTGKAVAKFGLAVDRGSKNSGTDFINITVWDKQAEVCAQYLKKGRLVAIVGRLNINAYEKDGQKRTYTEVVADQVRFLESANRDESLQGARPHDFEEVAKEVNLDDEDLPF